MPKHTQPHVFIKLVLCTSRSIAYHSDEAMYDPDSTVGDNIHKHLVSRFSQAFRTLKLSVEAQGYEVFHEFYVDTLYGEDFDLTISNRDDDELMSLVSAFEEEAAFILDDLPDELFATQ